MAIDPLQRQMFRIPGVNPGQVAGGIYNLSNMGNANTTPGPVAAQPLQVASLPPNAQVARAAPVRLANQSTSSTEVAAKPLGFTPEAVSRELPKVLGTFKGDFSAASNDELRDLWKRTNLVLETELKYEDKEIAPELYAENRAKVLAFRDEVATEAGNRGITLPGLDDDDVDPDAAAQANVSNNASKIEAAATNETKKAVARGEVSAVDADSALRSASDQVSALTSTGTMNFADALKAVGLDEKDYDANNYNAKAKELLGLDQNEADVPEWAAPIFLFGLNLMKAPTSSKTGQQGLGGLLGDIGAAGEVAFKDFRTERERKRKQRASIATLASSLRTQDLSLRKQVFSEYMDLKTFNKDLTDKIAARNIDLAKVYRGVERDNLTAAHRTAILGHEKERTANSSQKLMNSTRTYLAGEQNRAMAPYMEILKNNPQAMAKFAEAFKAAENKGVDTSLSAEDQLKNKLDRSMAPGYYASLAAIAAQDAGIAPAVQLKSIDFQGDKYSYDPVQASNYVATLNKNLAKSPDVDDRVQKFTVTGVLNEALSDPKSPHRRLIIGSPKTVIKSDPIEREGVTTERYINENARNKWFAANPEPTNPSEAVAYAAKVKAAESQWITVGESYIKGKPEFKERSFTNKEGEKIKYYFNDQAFSQRQKSQPNLSVEDVLLNPSKYSKIIQGKITDYAGRGGNIKTFTIFDKGKKRIVALDTLAYQNAIDDGRIDQGDGLASAVEKGVARYLGEGVDAKPLQTITSLGADGSLIQVTAQNARGVMAAFSSKKDQTDWRNRTTAVINLNDSAWDIRDFLQKGNALGLTSRALDWGASAASLSRLVKKQLGYSNSSVVSAFRGAATTEETRGMLNSALKSFDKSTSFGGTLIEDQATRSQIKSTFLNLAFGLASAREGGKLTDNDVRNALQTLGWDGTSWTQTPEAVVATLSNAVKDANNKYITEGMLRMSEEERLKLENATAEGKGGLIEQMLRKRALGSPDARAGAMYKHYLDNKTQPNLTLRFDYHEANRSPTATDGVPPRVAVDQSFKVMQIPADDLGIMNTSFSAARIPNQYRIAHRELFREPTEAGGFITYDSANDFATALKNRITDLYGGKGEGYKHNGLTARELGQKFIDYRTYLFSNGYFR